MWAAVGVLAAGAVRPPVRRALLGVEKAVIEEVEFDEDAQLLPQSPLGNSLNPASRSSCSACQRRYRCASSAIAACVRRMGSMPCPLVSPTV